MKKKAFKKTLAGVLAVATLASAMPMSLIADAYSYNNVPATDFTALATKLSDGTNVNLSNGGTAIAIASFDLKAYTYKIDKYEIPGVTEAGTGNVAGWDTTKAAQDIIDNVKDVTAVTFKADGTIDTITMNMPVTNDTIVNTAHNVAYQEIEFKVVRTKADMEAIFATTGGKEVGAILADNITSTNAITNEVQLQYMKLNLNLNGKNLTVNKGIKVTNQRLRIWGAGTSTIANDSGEDVPVLNTTGSAGCIEIYDNVKINATKSSSSTKPVISCEEGKILIAGDKVNVVHADGTAGKAVVGDGLVTGDYDYYEEAALTTQITDLSTLKDQDEFATSKKHTFNSKGIEVTARGTADVEKAAYYDADLKTDGLQYAYQPADETTAGTYVVDGKLDDSGASTIGISNAGQLYWLSEQVEGRTNNLNVNITANLDFAGMPEKFTPIDASGYQLQIKGADVAAGTNTMGRVISNIDILSATADAVTGQENAGLISKTKAGATNKIESIGIENAKVATTSKTDSYAGVFAGEANGLELLNVYTLNPTFTNAQFVGSAAAKFQNSSKMTYSYFAAKYPVFDAVDNSTIAILDTTIAGTVTNGKSVYYDSTLYTKANATQQKLSAATSADFKKGAVAFALNKHDATQTATPPVAWDETATTGTVDSNATSPYDGDYEDDVFGQTLDGTSYPTFLKLAATPGAVRIATNRVFRQLTQDCSGQTEAWTATNAQFGNEEIDLSGGHEDANADHRCDECGAYEISYWFDDTLAPFLSAKTTDDYGVAPSLDGKYVSLNKIGAMTSVTFDLRKTGKTADQIVDAINKVDAKGKTGIKGFELLNMAYTSGKELATATNASKIANIQIIVDDEVICKVYDSTAATAVKAGESADDVTEVGYKVANAVVTDAYKPAINASTTSIKVNEQAKPVPTTSIVVEEENLSAVTNAAANTKYDFYVAADKIDVGSTGSVNKSVNFASFASDKTKFTPNALNDYTFVIQFAGVKHNDRYDHDTNAADLGGWNIGAGDYAATGSIKLKKADGSGYGAKDASANGIDAADDADTSVHAFVGNDCGCVIEEAHENEFAITNKGHQGKCAVCALVLGAKKFDGEAAVMQKDNFEPHTYETVFTNGALTLKRCTVCGYTTFTKDATITVSTPEIEKLEDSDAAFRQKYAFNIAAGDKTIVQYGVLYSKEGKAIDATKVAVDTTNAAIANADKYFHQGTTATNPITIATGVLGDLKYTKKNSIKTGGTYNVNISVESENTDVTMCGYIIYQNADKTYDIATTDVVTNNFKDLAVAEIENNCAINYEGALDGVNSSGAAVWKNTYFSDVDSAFTIKEVGALVSKKSATPVTNRTLTTDADGTNIKKGTKTPTRSTTKAFTYAANIKKSDADLATTTMRGYLTVEYKGITHTLYTDVNNATNS